MVNAAFPPLAQMRIFFAGRRFFLVRRAGAAAFRVRPRLRLFRHRPLDRGERRFRLGGVGAAGLRHVGAAAAALAAQRLGADAHEIDGAEAPVRSSVTPTTSEALPSAVATKRHDAGADLASSRRRPGLADPSAGRRRRARPANLTPPMVLGRRRRLAAPPPSASARLAPRRARARACGAPRRGCDARRQLAGAGLERVGRLAQPRSSCATDRLAPRRRSAPRCGARRTRPRSRRRS